MIVRPHEHRMSISEIKENTDGVVVVVVVFYNLVCATVANDSFCFGSTDCKNGFGNLV